MIHTACRRRYRSRNPEGGPSNGIESRQRVLGVNQPIWVSEQVLLEESVSELMRVIRMAFDDVLEIEVSLSAHSLVFSFLAGILTSTN